MPLLYYTHESDDRIQSFYAAIPKEKAQVDVIPKEIEDDKGQTSSLATAISNYENLPHYLKSCFDYCCIATNYYWEKRQLVRLLMAQSLIPEKPGEIIEDIGANILDELIGLGMLKESGIFERRLQVSELYRESCLLQVEEKDFIDKAVNSPIHLFIRDDGKHLPSNFKSLLIRSLFAKARVRDSSNNSYCHEAFSQVYLETVCGLQFLSVLVLDSSVDYLPDEMGNLVHLQYLGLYLSKIKKLPCALGNLLKLQTLIIRSTSLRELPIEILNNKQLRHLLMIEPTYPYFNYFHDGIRVPKGFATLVNLQSFTGVYAAGSGFASELSTLTQLRELGLHCVSEDHADEISAAIMKMDNLISLSLQAEQTRLPSSQKETKKRVTILPPLLPEFESFSPPPHLQKLRLHGGLIEIPNWLLSMENLIKLDLNKSDLLENPTSFLQFLPKLKNLTLWDAYKAKVIGKEFCEAGGLPELETLIICSEDLTAWTEIENGAFPKLRHLQFCNCFNLKFLPEGLQNISTIQELYLRPSHGDLARRLTGEENYKIKHISKFQTLSSEVGVRWGPR